MIGAYVVVVVVVVTTLSTPGSGSEDSQERATHVVVFTEGARWRTGRWPDAIVADDKGESLDGPSNCEGRYGE